MNIYAIWVDLVDSSQDLEFVHAVNEFLGALRYRGQIHDFSIERRKLGFGPEGLGEFHLRIETTSLAQLDEAFFSAAARSEPLETLHANVFRRVTNYKSALYRTFPDSVRVQK
jgi:hypothetical protein